MGKKILILNGSPRKTGNTVALTAEFKKGAEEAGNVVTEFFLAGMNINGCKGCFCGGKNPDSPCVQKDDMDKIYPVYREADVIVLATPLYYWTISGQLKTAFDRLFAVAECDPNYRNPKKESVLIMAAEGYGFEETLYWDVLCKGWFHHPNTHWLTVHLWQNDTGWKGGDQPAGGNRSGSVWG